MSTHEALGTDGVDGGMPKEMCDKIFEVVDAGKATHARAHSRSVRMVYCTDLLGPMHRHQLLKFSIRSAFQSPAGLIASATVTAAELFMIEDRIGVVAPGLLADIIAVRGNPLEDIGVLQDPDRYLALIIKDSQIYKNELPSSDS